MREDWDPALLMADEVANPEPPEGDWGPAPDRSAEPEARSRNGVLLE